MDSQSTPHTTDHDASNIRIQPESLIPPYWQHRRQISHASVISTTSTITKPPPIILEDHTGELEALTSPLWARSVSIENHVLVAGNITGVGSYVVWICKVFTLDGGSMIIRKRYSEFEALRERLALTFPKSGSSLPPLPPKSLIYRFRPEFLEKRRAGLAYFLNCILLNPEYAGSAVLKEFIFS